MKIFVRQPYSLWHFFRLAARWCACAAVLQASAHAQSPAPAAAPKWRFVSEEHWIVDETVRSIAELLAFAKGGAADAVKVTVTPAATPHAYQLAAQLGRDTVAAELALRAHVWSPEEYAAWAKALLAAWKLTAPAASAHDAGLALRLTEPTPAVLMREAQRLSAALTKAPLDSALHTQAALVTEAFAFRETAREFSDYRRELCRVAAHLAIARALQPEAANTTARLAQTALEVLTGRQAKALEALTPLASETDAGTAAWGRALRMRTTCDWRPEADKPTLFEQLEIFRMRAKGVDSEFATNWLKDRPPAVVHDWRRMLLETNFSVEEGHQFAKDSIGQEILSLQTDWAGFFGGKLDEEMVLKALTEPAGRPVAKDAKGRLAISVLGWDFWSAQHQRHLCQSISATDDFLKEKWGVPDYAEARRAVRRMFAPLPLFPLLDRILNENPAALAAIVKRINGLVTAHPEQVSGAAWARVVMDEKDSASAPLDPLLWLGRPVPFGTGYDFWFRSDYLKLPTKSEKDWWEALAALAPLNSTVRYYKLQAEFGNQPPAAEIEAAFTHFIGFDTGSLWRISELQKERPAAYAATMAIYAALDPNQYFKLGDYHREHAQPDLAVAAYRKGVELCADRVSVSNKCDWLVEYLDEHGEKKEALAIATMAAEVYSSGGLETLALLQERRGQFKAAEDTFHKLAERYERNEEIDAFYARNRAKDPDYETRASGNERKIFPKGLEKVTLADCKEPPDSGVVLKGTSARTKAYGLTAGDVVVAADGLRARNMTQFSYLRALPMSTKMRLIVWTRGVYREIETDLPLRRFGVDVGNYSPR